MIVTPIQQASLGEQVARELRRLIATREIAPGTPALEEQLAARFEVSRGPVRDALKVLAAEGLITNNGRRTEFRGLTPVDIDELFSLRRILESAAIGMAMDRDLRGLIADLEKATGEMEEAARAGGHEAFAAADQRFHRALFDVSGHSRLTTIWDLYRPSIELVLLASRETYEDLAPSIASHHVLIDLIKTGDPTAVHEELTHHIENARGRVRAYYEHEEPGPES